MGRPPLRKKGPFTDAERQRRRRQRLRREAKEVEVEERTRARAVQHRQEEWAKVEIRPPPMTDEQLEAERKSELLRGVLLSRLSAAINQCCIEHPGISANEVCEVINELYYAVQKQAEE